MVEAPQNQTNQENRLFVYAQVPFYVIALNEGGLSVTKRQRARLRHCSKHTITFTFDLIALGKVMG